MRFPKYLIWVMLSAFLFVVAGCGDAPKNVVQPSEKTGLSPEERKEKRGN
jgi:hypothetical protein